MEIIGSLNGIFLRGDHIRVCEEADQGKCFKATIVDVKDGVTLKKEDGSTYTVPTDALITGFYDRHSFHKFEDDSSKDALDELIKRALKFLEEGDCL